jgi:hypothetical protein
VPVRRDASQRVYYCHSESADWRMKNLRMGPDPLANRLGQALAGQASSRRVGAENDPGALASHLRAAQDAAGRAYEGRAIE